jgi:hypothetical protein
VTVWNAESWTRQRGTFPTSAKVLVRDLQISLGAAAQQLGRLAKRGTIVRLCPGRFIHCDAFPEDAMATLILYDSDGVVMHRADFPNRLRADIALRIVERDIRARRPAVRVVGHDIHDALYTVSGVARAMIQPTPTAAGIEAAEEAQHFDARSRAAGDDR